MRMHTAGNVAACRCRSSYDVPEPPKGMRIIASGSLTHNRDLVKGEYEKLGIPRISHGGMWESAMFMACNHEYVDPDKLKHAEPGPYETSMLEKYGKETVPAYEEIRQISLEFGERLVQTAAERIAANALEALHSGGESVGLGTESIGKQGVERSSR